MNEFRVLNGKGDIEVKILKPANAVFQTDEFHVDSTVTVYKNAFNIFNLVLENQQLKNDINKLQKELNEENLQCSKYVIEINNLQEKYDKQVDNWNMLKEHLTNRYNNGTESISYRQVFIEIKEMMQVLEIQQELEGSDSNE